VVSIKWRRLRERGLPQLVQQRLRLFQIRGVEAFGEPAIDRREKCVRFLALPLAHEEPGEARRRPQFP
jgi:hypothetical protein